jgi:tripartite ATP-independent transporter DctP family solute receptor
MARLLEERSGGRLRTKLFPGGVLGEERDTLEITIFGGLDFNRVNLGPLNSIAKETLVPTLPFMFRSIAHMRNSMDGAPGDAILKSLEPHGLIGLCFYDSGARSFYTTDRLIERPEDLAGLKIRVQSSDIFVSLVEALGGDATPMAYGEVYQGLLQGVIDGAENNWPSYESTRHFEAAKYYSLTRHVMAPEVLLMSAKRWAKLSSEDQALIRQCARDSVPLMRDIWDARVAQSRAIVMEAGVQLIEPDIAPFQERVRPVWDRYLDTPELRALASGIEAVEG